MIHLFPNKEK